MKPSTLDRAKSLLLIFLAGIIAAVGLVTLMQGDIPRGLVISGFGLFNVGVGILALYKKRGQGR